MTTFNACINTSNNFLRNLIQQAAAAMSQLSYSEFVTPIMHAEFDSASEYDTKKTICERAAKKITSKVHQILQVPEQSNSRSAVHPDVAKMIEDYYKSMANRSCKMDDLKMRFAVFKSSDCLEPHIIKNLIREFIKHSQDPDNKKRLVDNHLNVILAVDGMTGARPADLVNYIPNLANVSDAHVAAVREMYGRLTEIVGTDAVYMIRKCLLETYSTCNRNGDYDIMLTKEKDNVDKYFREREDMIDEEELAGAVNRCKKIYEDKVGDQLERFAVEKLSAFWNFLKRKVESKNNKRKAQEEKETEEEKRDEREREHVKEKKVKKVKEEEEKAKEEEEEEEKEEEPPAKKVKAHKKNKKCKE